MVPVFPFVVRFFFVIQAKEYVWCQRKLWFVCTQTMFCDGLSYVLEFVGNRSFFIKKQIVKSDNIPYLGVFLFWIKFWTNNVWLFSPLNGYRWTIGKIRTAGNWKKQLFYQWKVENPDIVKKLNPRRIACSKYIRMRFRIFKKEITVFSRRRPSSSPWGPSSLPWGRSSWYMNSDFIGNEDGLHGKKRSTSRQFFLFSSIRSGFFRYLQKLYILTKEVKMYNKACLKSYVLELSLGYLNLKLRYSGCPIALANASHFSF